MVPRVEFKNAAPAQNNHVQPVNISEIKECLKEHSIT